MSGIVQSIKQYWRVYLLVIVSIISIAIVFNPLIPGLEIGAQVDDGNFEETEPSLVQQYTGLQFNIELGGGTRIRAPLVGMTAEGGDIGDQNIGELEQSIADDFENTTSSDVTVREPEDGTAAGNTTVEIKTREPTEEAFGDSLNRNNVEYENIRGGLTEETVADTVSILQSRIDAAGLSGGDVRQVEMQDGTVLILVEVPDIDRQQTINLITERGEVHVDAYYQNEEGEYTTRTVLERDDFRTIGSPQQATDSQPPHVPVTVEPTAAEKFQDDVVDTGLGQPGGTTCQYETAPEETQPCLLTILDGEVVFSAGMSSSLASSMSAGTWAQEGSFILQTGSFEEAQTLSTNLQSGALPATLDIENGEVNFVSPSQGEEFRMIAFVVGLLATLAVATSVSLRYGNPKIAAPMLVTVGAEVIILLAIAVMLSYPIDIAVIAGLVAVIGTGVDDLIIISDRVMGGSNPASSTRVFDRRFKRALWIIMSAAGTTILALGPLAILELRQLQGFAIFTIIGVIAGVLITRPAYGDILRYFFTDKRTRD